VTVPLLGQEAVFTLIGAGLPQFSLEASGNPGDAFTVTRYFLVANGGVDALTRIRNEILGVATGVLAGTVTSGGQPVADADIAVTGTPVAGPPLNSTPTKNVVSHARTAANGTYSIDLPAGSFTVQANKNGRLAASPPAAAFSITNGAQTTQDFTVPAAGAIHVFVTDESNAAIPAKVQLVGSDPSPDPRNSQSILGLINNNMGVFNEQFEDGVQQGIANVTFADKNGDTGVFEIEPGTYQLAVSHGPRYSAFLQNVTITAGSTTTVNARIAKVVPTPGFIPRRLPRPRHPEPRQRGHAGGARHDPARRR
jgi:hypothetical protein